MRTFLTFVGDQCGNGQKALDFYLSIFPDAALHKTIHYRENEGGGTPELIKYAEFQLMGQAFGLSESNYQHNWSFSPAVSILIQDSSEESLQELFTKLSANGGQVMVPFDAYKGEGDYGFGEKFGWCADAFGVNWQFILNA